MRKETFMWGNAEIVIGAEGLPRKLYVELSSRCNFTCSGCFREAFEEEGRDLPEALFPAVLEAAGKAGVRELFVGGIGEPLLHPGFTRFVSEACQRGAAVSVQTNGALLDDAMTDFLVSAGVHRVILSYETGSLGHAADAVSSGVSGGGERLPGFPGGKIRGLRKAREAAGSNRPLIALEWVLTAGSVPTMADFADAALEYGVEEVLFSNLLPVATGMEEALLYPEENGLSSAGFLRPFIDRVRHRLHYTVPHFTLPTERHCRFVEQGAMVVRSDGSVAPCYRFLRDGHEIVLGKRMDLKAHNFGSLAEKSVREIWNSRDYLWFRFTVENGLYPSCTDCTLREGCEYLRDSEGHCWGGSPSCGNCLWSRGIILCP